MKRTGLVLLVLFCVTGVNVFGMGASQKRKQEIERLEAEIEFLQRENRDLGNQNRNLAIQNRDLMLQNRELSSSTIQTLTVDLLSRIDSYYIDLSDLDFFISAPLVLTKNSTGEIGRAEGRALVLEAETSRDIYIIEKEMVGVIQERLFTGDLLVKFTTPYGDFFIVFEKNLSLNRYDIKSVTSTHGPSFAYDDSLYNHYLTVRIKDSHTVTVPR